jgi:hypothetical protein
VKGREVEGGKERAREQIRQEGQGTEDPQELGGLTGWLRAMRLTLVL